MSLLEVHGLSVRYETDGPPAVAVRDVDLRVDDGEMLGLAGESGCGKSTLVHAVLGLLPPGAAVTGGTIRLGGVDLRSVSEEEFRRLRWTQIAVVLQSSMNALNPVLRIERQFADLYEAHGVRPAPRLSPGELLEMVKVPPDRLRAYPHQLSGGMRQRVAIALALALKPALVIMDEPTTGLDVVVQSDIFDTLREIRRERPFAVLLVTHDLGLLLQRADRVAIMYAGRLVEMGRAANLTLHPRHPYTLGLLQAFPDIGGERRRFYGIDGSPPSLADLPSGCAFHPRCTFATEACRTVVPPIERSGGDLLACHHPVSPIDQADPAGGEPA